MPDGNKGPQTGPMLLVYAPADEAWAQWVAGTLGDRGAVLLTTDDPAAAPRDAAYALWILHSEASAGSRRESSALRWAQRAGLLVRYLRLDDTPVPRTGGRVRALDLRSGPTRQATSRMRRALARDTPTAADGPTATSDSTVPVTRKRRSARSTATHRDEVHDLERRFPIPALPPGPVIPRPEVKVALEAAFAERPASTGAIVVLFGTHGAGKTLLASSFAADRRASGAATAWTDGPHWHAAARKLLMALSDPSVVEDGPTHAPRGLLVVDDADEELSAILEFDRRRFVDILVVVAEAPETTRARGDDLIMVEISPRIGDGAAEEFVRAMLPDVSAAVEKRIVELTGRHVALLATLGAFPAAWQRGEASGVISVSRAAEEASAGGYFLDTEDPRIITRWERAFVQLPSEGAIELGPFRRGSWFREWRRRPSTRDAADSAVRAVEVAAVVAPEAVANRDNAEAIARLIEASASTPNVAVNAGSIVLVKVTDDAGTSRIVSETLTPTQLKAFKSDEKRLVLADPSRALSYLVSLSGEDPLSLPAPPPDV
jgi:hypothetical protein